MTLEDEIKELEAEIRRYEEILTLVRIRIKQLKEIAQ